MGQKRTNEAEAVDRHVGLRLRQLRQDRGMSLADMAGLMGHNSGQAVSKYEQGGAFPSALMFKTASALDVPISTFFEALTRRDRGVDEAAEPSASAGLTDSTETRKVMVLMRGAAASLHPMIHRVVRAMVATTQAAAEASRPSEADNDGDSDAVSEDAA